MWQGGQYLIAVVLSAVLMQTASRPLNNPASNSTSSKTSPSWFQVTSSGPGCLVPRSGETIQLTCTVKGALQSQMTITWYRATWYSSCCAVKVLSRCFGQSCVEIETTTGSETNVTMKIVGFHELHSGIYFCAVTDALIPEAKITSTPTEIKLRESPSLVSVTQCNDNTTCSYPFKSVPQFSPEDICTNFESTICMPPALSDINLDVTSGTTTAVFSLQWKTSTRECAGYQWFYQICPFNTANVPSHYSMNTNVKYMACGSQGVSGMLNRNTKTIKQHNAKQGWYYVMQVKRVVMSQVQEERLETTFTSAPLFVGKYVPASITAAPSEITVGRPSLPVRLWCNVTGEPKPEVFFLKVLNTEYSRPHSTGGKAAPSGSTTTIHYQYVYADENATYMCAARNEIIAKDRGTLKSGDFAWIQVRRV